MGRRPIKRKDVTLESKVSTKLPAVWADSDRLGQVLSSLLDNVLRHSHRGDSVVVSDRFYRVEAARDRDHGGAGIKADSGGPGLWSTFTFSLPQPPYHNAHCRQSGLRFHRERGRAGDA